MPRPRKEKSELSVPRLNYLMKLRKKTIEGLADDLNIHVNTLKQAKSLKKIDPQYLNDIAKCLNVHPAYLMGKDLGQYRDYLGEGTIAHWINENGGESLRMVKKGYEDTTDPINPLHVVYTGDLQEFKRIDDEGFYYGYYSDYEHDEELSDATDSLRNLLSTYRFSFPVYWLSEKEKDILQRRNKGRGDFETIPVGTTKLLYNYVNNFKKIPVDYLTDEDLEQMLEGFQELVVKPIMLKKGYISIEEFYGEAASYRDEIERPGKDMVLDIFDDESQDPHELLINIVESLADNIAENDEEGESNNGEH